MIKMLLELLYHVIGGIFLFMLLSDEVNRHILRADHEFDVREAEILNSLIESMESLEKRRPNHE